MPSTQSCMYDQISMPRTAGWPQSYSGVWWMPSERFRLPIGCATMTYPPCAPTASIVLPVGPDGISLAMAHAQGEQVSLAPGRDLGGDDQRHAVMDALPAFPERGEAVVVGQDDEVQPGGARSGQDLLDGAGAVAVARMDVQRPGALEPFARARAARVAVGWVGSHYSVQYCAASLRRRVVTQRAVRTGYYKQSSAECPAHGPPRLGAALDFADAQLDKRFGIEYQV